ncbi:MAG: hypothetical protein AAF799_00950 [Myxococcota bacterium]
MDRAALDPLLDEVRPEAPEPPLPVDVPSPISVISVARGLP